MHSLLIVEWSEPKTCRSLGVAIGEVAVAAKTSSIVDRREFD